MGQRGTRSGMGGGRGRRAAGDGTAENRELLAGLEVADPHHAVDLDYDEPQPENEVEVELVSLLGRQLDRHPLPEIRGGDLVGDVDRRRAPVAEALGRGERA